MPDTTLRVGLVGTGFMGRVHANCWLALPGAELVAIADPTPESREKCPGSPEKFATHQEMLANADVDIVDVCTPTPWHAEAAIAGLEACLLYTSVSRALSRRRIAARRCRCSGVSTPWMLSRSCFATAWACSRFCCGLSVASWRMACALVRAVSMKPRTDALCA